MDGFDVKMNTKLMTKVIGGLKGNTHIRLLSFAHQGLLLLFYYLMREEIDRPALFFFLLLTFCLLRNCDFRFRRCFSLSFSYSLER